MGAADGLVVFPNLGYMLSNTQDNRLRTFFRYGAIGNTYYTAPYRNISTVLVPKGKGRRFKRLKGQPAWTDKLPTPKRNTRPYSYPFPPPPPPSYRTSGKHAQNNNNEVNKSTSSAQFAQRRSRGACARRAGLLATNHVPNNPSDSQSSGVTSQRNESARIPLPYVSGHGDFFGRCIAPFARTLPTRNTWPA